ncbi:uncharacterized protein K460DRAFT_113514 [Cucurbitaria berberidis CBS 394.84]|uniref:Uncharacterized protein n=1 Tax=Cucurbitaria berberidis CBS 394.84 TaxID=1168544 RepID=A0A9P4L8U1_9PLEO|nr:uncharacterized protein K460DRAFT_113514 [Cucurbitaria berberidis CBS 394.84]KAF1845707.1 hypothetical protein K460DRAFT_113514 [Cucurbitaria berberidis CBS 394.84]
MGTTTDKRLSRPIVHTPRFQQATRPPIVLWVQPMKITMLERGPARLGHGRNSIESTARLLAVTRSDHTRLFSIVDIASISVAPMSMMVASASVYFFACMQGAKGVNSSVSFAYSSLLLCFAYSYCQKASVGLMPSSPTSFSDLSSSGDAMRCWNTKYLYYRLISLSFFSFQIVLLHVTAILNEHSNLHPAYQVLIHFHCLSFSRASCMPAAERQVLLL